MPPFGGQRRTPPDENPKAAWAAVRDHVQPRSLLTADEHGSYDDLVGLAILQRVNHSKAYQTEDGTDTNRIESFFARAERSYVGIHHRFSVKFLDWYMAMVAWKEDTRYMVLRWQLADVLRNKAGCLAHIILPGRRQLSVKRIGITSRMAPSGAARAAPVSFQTILRSRAKLFIHDTRSYFSEH